MAVHFYVPLFEEDISDYMRRVRDDLELEQEHQVAPAVDGEESQLLSLKHRLEQSLNCPTSAVEYRYLPAEL